MTSLASSGLERFRPAGPGSRVALVAPASPFSRSEFEAGLKELTRLEFVPVYDERVFDKQEIVAGSAETRANSILDYLSRPDIDAVIAVRGGYGSVETLPKLPERVIREHRTALVGYSDLTSLHVFQNCYVGMTSVHGPMIEGRLATGASAYDPVSFLKSLSLEPLGQLAPEGLDIVRPGEVAGPLFGGTLTQIVASLGTPYAFRPPEAGYVLLIEEVAERPYRIRRMLMQLRLSGLLAQASAVVLGQLPRCDEPDRPGSARAVVTESLSDFPGPVLIGFPTGHTTTPLVSVPLGVECRVVGRGRPALVFDEAAAA